MDYRIYKEIKNGAINGHLKRSLLASFRKAIGFAEFLYFQGFLPALVRSAFAGFSIPVTAFVPHGRDTLGSFFPDDIMLARLRLKWIGFSLLFIVKGRAATMLRTPAPLLIPWYFLFSSYNSLHIPPYSIGGK